MTEPTSSVVVSMPQVAPADSSAIAVTPSARDIRKPGPKTPELIPRLQNAVNKWVPLAQYQLTRLGPAGMAGVGASAAAAVIGGFALLSLRTANENLHAEILRA